MDYYSLLDQNNFIAFLQSIIDNDPNPTIVTAAKQISFEIQGNKDIAKYYWYNELYNKYKFNLQIINTNEGKKVVLYSSLNQTQKYNYIGVIETPKPKQAEFFVPPTPTPTPSVTCTPTPTPSVQPHLVLHQV